MPLVRGVYGLVRICLRSRVRHASANAGDIGRAFVSHHPTPLDALGDEPGNGLASKADTRWFLLVRQYLDIGEASGVFNGHLDLS